MQDRFGEAIALDRILVTHVHLQPLDLATTLQADDAGAIVRGGLKGASDSST